MNANQPTEVVEVLPPGNPLREQAFRLILSGETRPSATVDQRLDTVKSTVAAQGINLDLLVAALRGKQLTAAAMAIESPGRSALIYLSPLPDSTVGHNASVRVLRELQDQGWKRNIALLQAMASPGETRLERALSKAGFRFLAELIYADCPRGTTVPQLPVPPMLDLLSYSPQYHELFLRGLEQTYTESLDCADLSGVRSTEDVLAGHRATGCYDPSLWFLARLDGAIAGVLLLSPLRHRNVLEVAYIGVAHGFRRRGVAHVLMRKTHDEMIACGFDGITLAVDGVNAPARALYGKWGFVETGRRRVWVAIKPS